MYNMVVTVDFKGGFSLFGYVRPYKPDLRIREFDDYKAVYCTICKRTRKLFGFFEGFTLSYDFAFMAILLLSLDDVDISPKNGRCVYNPLKKCSFCEIQGNQIDFCANVAMLLVYYKLDDSVLDSKGVKKLLSKLLRLFFKTSYKKAARAYPQINEFIGNSMREQFEIEKTNTSDIDEAANPTAQMLSYLAAYNNKDESKTDALKRLGYCLGRWVYLIDAADDCQKDSKNGSYNVYLKKYEQAGALTKETKEQINSSLNFCAVEAAHMLYDLQTEKHRPILENILTDGLYNVQNLVFKENKKK